MKKKTDLLTWKEIQKSIQKVNEGLVLIELSNFQIEKQGRWCLSKQWSIYNHDIPI